ncbi:MAG TPA: RNA methyltransferase [Steroidobacteraceae bacterium]|jgi:TrmH family RNA methyltransferase
MKFDDVKKLHQKRYREEFGHYLVEGEHLIEELQKAAETNPALKASEVFVTADREPWQGPLTMRTITASQMAQLSETKTPQGIVALVPRVPALAARTGERAIYLNEVQDPGNLGTILRTLAWFGGFRCLLSPGSVDPYNSKVIRASMGAIFHVPLEVAVDAAVLQGRYRNVASLELAGDSIAAEAFRRHDCYVFGNEARGLSADVLAGLQVTPFTIAGRGGIESLNLAAAVNMCVYELNRESRS